jgi:uncharacterized protein (DUF2267 family)
MVHVAALEKTYQKTDEWIRDVMGELHTGDPEIAYSALHATLRALRDRLTPEENAQLGAQLPTVIRGLFYEGWTPHKKRLRLRGAKEFLAYVEQFFPSHGGIDAELAARAVFKVLSRRVSTGEIMDILFILPVEIRELWPAAIPA